jgi:hypothetical protein
MNKQLIKELTEEAQELINYGNSNEKAMGQGMMNVLNQLNQPLIVTGQTSGTDDNRIIQWEDPDTGEAMWSQGEFDYDPDLDKFTHDVMDEDGNLLYTVHA